MTDIIFLRNQYCPYCNRRIVSIKGQYVEPSEGDAAICFYCGEVMVFGKLDASGKERECRIPTVNYLTWLHEQCPEINQIRKNIIERGMLRNRW